MNNFNEDDWTDAELDGFSDSAKTYLSVILENCPHKVSVYKRLYYPISEEIYENINTELGRVGKYWVFDPNETVHIWDTWIGTGQRYYFFFADKEYANNFRKEYSTWNMTVMIIKNWLRNLYITFLNIIHRKLSSIQTNSKSSNQTKENGLEKSGKETLLK